MASYTIYEKPGLSAEEAISSAILVKNRYSMLAFFFPLIWLLIKRLWWILLVYLIVMVPVVALDAFLPTWSGMLVTLLIGLWFSVEAPNLVGWSLERKGYVEVATLFAEDTDHCERRYAQARMAMAAQKSQAGHRPIETRPMTARSDQVSRHHGSDAPVIGLFPAPDTSRENK